MPQVEVLYRKKIELNQRLNFVNFKSLHDNVIATTAPQWNSVPRMTWMCQIP